MADDLETALKNVANQVAGYVKNVATLSVETRIVQVDANTAASFDQARPAARTIIKLDGDSEAVVPVQQGDSGLVVDRSLFEMHERSVNTAIEYRAKMLDALLNVFRSITS